MSQASGGRGRPDAPAALRLLLGLAVLAPQFSRADAAVTNCTQAALEQALSQRGLVPFTNNCSLTLPRTLLLTNEVTLSGGSPMAGRYATKAWLVTNATASRFYRLVSP